MDKYNSMRYTVSKNKNKNGDFDEEAEFAFFYRLSDFDDIDAGVYTCTARNEVGTTKRDFTALVHGDLIDLYSYRTFLMCFEYKVNPHYFPIQSVQQRPTGLPNPRNPKNPKRKMSLLKLSRVTCLENTQILITVEFIMNALQVGRELNNINLNVVQEQSIVLKKDIVDGSETVLVMVVGNFQEMYAVIKEVFQHLLYLTF